MDAENFLKKFEGEISILPCEIQQTLSETERRYGDKNRTGMTEIMPVSPKSADT